MAKVIEMIDTESGDSVHMYSVDAREAMRNPDKRYRPKTPADEAVTAAQPLGAAKVERFGEAPQAPGQAEGQGQDRGPSRGGDLGAQEPQTDAGPNDQAGQPTVQNEGGPATPELPGDPTPTQGGSASVVAPQGGSADEPGSEVPSASGEALFS